MIDPIEKLSMIQILTSVKGTNIESVSAQNQKNTYSNKSLQISNEDGSKEQIQETMMTYHHHN